MEVTTTTENQGFNPKEVLSPSKRWKLFEILYECRDWSLALGEWETDGKRLNVLAQRWNGSKGTKGNPTSRGVPTWFIIPEEIWELYVESDFVSEAKRDDVRTKLKLPPSFDKKVKTTKPIL